MKQWMNYVGVINDGAVAGRRLVMFILGAEGSIEEEELWEEEIVSKVFRELNSLKFEF